MVADVTETRNVIPSLGFKTFMTILSFYLFLVQRYAAVNWVKPMIEKKLMSSLRSLVK